MLILRAFGEYDTKRDAGHEEVLHPLALGSCPKPQVVPARTRDKSSGRKSD